MTGPLSAEDLIRAVINGDPNDPEVTGWLTRYRATEARVREHVRAYLTATTDIELVPIETSKHAMGDSPEHSVIVHQVCPRGSGGSIGAVQQLPDGRWASTIDVTTQRFDRVHDEQSEAVADILVDYVMGKVNVT